MTKKLTRRELLKLAGLLPLAYAVPTLFLEPDREPQDSDAPNIIIIVFDALTARNMSLFGYPRETTPNLIRLSEKATVFHNHYAGGNFTFPGTASLLTGTYPWTNRAFSRQSGIDKSFANKNIFQSFNQHYRLCYSHNTLAQKLLKRFRSNIDHFKDQQALYLNQDVVVGKIFANDEDIASVAWSQGMIKEGNQSSYSLFLSHSYENNRQELLEQYTNLFPRGIPNIRNDNFFLLEDAIDWTQNIIKQVPEPFLSYIHYLPPHAPYFTRKEFIDVFANDKYMPIEKPPHTFSQGKSHGELKEERRWYDEFVLLVDAEFERLYKNLEKNGILENSWLVVTSDHGEMFERGISQHFHETFHQPAVQIPLLIFEPGQQSRKDIFTPTSAVDIFPTLLHLSDKEIPDWCEGKILPPYSDNQSENERSVFALEAKENKIQ